MNQDLVDEVTRYTRGVTNAIAGSRAVEKICPPNLFLPRAGASEYILHNTRTMSVPTDKEVYDALSEDLSNKDEVMKFAQYAQEVEQALASDDDEEEEEGDEEEDAPEEAEGPLLDTNDLHDGEAGQIRRLMGAKKKPPRTSSLAAVAKVRKVAEREAGMQTPVASDEDEEQYLEDDEDKEVLEGGDHKYEYGHEEIPDSDEEDGEFVTKAPTELATKLGLTFDTPDGDFVPPPQKREIRERRKVFVAAMANLAKLLPEGTTIPTGGNLDAKPFNVLYVNEKDFGDFCVLCTKVYHELLLGINASTRKTTGIDKDVMERYKAAEKAFVDRMMAIGANIMRRVSDINFGAQSDGKIKGVHPWYVTWTILRHAVRLDWSEDLVESPADGFCCVTGRRLQKGDPCYVVSLARKEIDNKEATNLFRTYMLVSRYSEDKPEGYRRFVESAFTLWNHGARIADWMKEWKRENPLSAPEIENGPDLLMGSEKGRKRLAAYYLELKAHSALIQLVLTKDEGVA